MRRVIPVVAMVGAVWTAGVIAQGRNFAGTWTIDAERTSAANASVAGAGGGVRGAGGGGRGAAVGTVSAGTTTGGTVAVAGGGGGGRGGAVTAVGAGGAGMRSGGAGGPVPTTISMNAGSFTIGSGENSTTYKTDGSLNTITTPAGTEVKAKATWKDDKLVIETTTETPNGPRNATNTWYLDGESLVRETSTTTPDGQAVTRKTIFKKS
jgi:hypothetical protein